MKKRMVLLLVIILLFAYTFAGCRMERAWDPGEQVLALDVSSWNEKVDWKKVRKQDINYAMIKIGSGAKNGGEYREDPYFKRNYKKGVHYGMNLGVYFYSYATTIEQAKQEAKDCLAILEKYQIKPEDLTMPVAFDVEEDEALSTGRDCVTDMAVAFCEEIKAAGYTPMIYANAQTLNWKFHYRKIKNYKIWVAHYGVEKPDWVHPYSMWQYTEKGSVEGANTDLGICDLNYYIVEEMQ